MNFRIATYNVHRCRGLDRRVLPKRIAEVLRPLQADVIALQEVLGAVPKGTAMIRNVALPLGWVMGSTREGLASSSHFRTIGDLASFGTVSSLVFLVLLLR